MNDLDLTARIVVQRAGALALYARQWLDDPGSAEDVVQEALVRLLTQRRPPDDPAAWMFRTVRNAAIDLARSTTRRRRREQAVAVARREWFDSRTGALLEARDAEDALRRLDAESREVVVLRIWGGLGFAQIAEVVGLSVSTVHERYVSALREMRRQLEKPCAIKTTTTPG